jgi:RHS repeat-associated protein
MVGETSFAFVRNLQGDVIAMVDCEGDIVVEYSYDPWGNIEYHLAEGVTEDEAIIFTALCPLTYRGYNYDFTTGLYYLQSRYYNPEWGRFLNCDDTNILLATQDETHNANLFAYCNNNPVNRVDYDGKKSSEVSNYIIYISIYLDGALGHAELKIGSNIYSYGAYGKRRWYQTITGCSGHLVIVHDISEWYQYDKVVHDNRKRTDYPINVTGEELWNILFCYATLVSCANGNFRDKDYKGVRLNNKGEYEAVVVDSSPDANGYIDIDWTIYDIKTSRYKTYYVHWRNCTTVITDVLSNSMPSKYNRTIIKMNSQTPIIHPYQLAEFALTFQMVS